MGLYTKADIAWKNFIRFSRNGKDKKEIRTRLAPIAEPLRIETGYNKIMAGRYEEGIMDLEPSSDRGSTTGGLFITTWEWRMR